MKLSSIFAVFILIEIVEGAWWILAVKPIILSFGAAIIALNLEFQPNLNEGITVKKKNKIRIRKKLKPALEVNNE